jgi:hypothetical protein
MLQVIYQASVVDVRLNPALYPDKGERTQLKTEQVNDILSSDDKQNRFAHQDFEPYVEGKQSGGTFLSSHLARNVSCFVVPQ